jgi:hypothetical protein
MRWLTRSGPKGTDAPEDAQRAEPPRTRDECADFVDLARRMSIPDEDAIRQFVDVAMVLGAERPTPPN